MGSKAVADNGERAAVKNPSPWQMAAHPASSPFVVYGALDSPFLACLCNGLNEKSEKFRLKCRRRWRRRNDHVHVGGWGGRLLRTA